MHISDLHAIACDGSSPIFRYGPLYVNLTKCDCAVDEMRKVYRTMKTRVLVVFASYRREKKNKKDAELKNAVMSNATIKTVTS